jgi:hypothetical protein
LTIGVKMVTVKVYINGYFIICKATSLVLTFTLGISS